MKAKSPNIDNSIKTTKLRRKASKISLIKKIEIDEIMTALRSLGKGNPLVEDKKDNTIIQ